MPHNQTTKTSDNKSGYLFSTSLWLRALILMTLCLVSQKPQQEKKEAEEVAWVLSFVKEFFAFWPTISHAKKI